MRSRALRPGPGRPRAGRARLAATALLAAGVAACSSDGARPRVGGGETHWLSLCRSEVDCAGWRCLCGVCTAACDGAPCRAGATCFAPGSAELAAFCGDAAAPATCLAACDDQVPCPAGFACAEGVCRPRDVAAFTGAEGFAGRLRGGRGGRVLRVTSLAESGEGTLQAALDAPGARTIVFAVSGVIDAPELTLSHGEVTIAGQTAPGAGVTLRGRLLAEPQADVADVIVRHLRVRPAYDGSDPLQFDAIQLSAVEGLLLDHVSAALAVDDTVDLFAARRITVQWSTVEASLDVSLPSGAPYQGLVAGPSAGEVSIHHVLFTHHQDDNPSVAGGPAEVVNNLVYDARHGFAHHGAASGPFDLVGNAFVAGPSSSLRPVYFDDEATSPDAALAYYLDGNVVEGAGSECGEGALDDPWAQCAYDLGRDASYRVDAPFDRAPWPEHVAITTEDAAAARAAVLARAGAFPRDGLTRQAIEDIEALGAAGVRRRRKTCSRGSPRRSRPATTTKTAWRTTGSARGASIPTTLRTITACSSPATPPSRSTSTSSRRRSCPSEMELALGVGWGRGGERGSGMRARGAGGAHRCSRGVGGALAEARPLDLRRRGAHRWRAAPR